MYLNHKPGEIMQIDSIENAVAIIRIRIDKVRNAP